MAFWNSPREVEDHAFKATCCALQMHEKLEYLNEKWNEEIQQDFPVVKCRIGIHSGSNLKEKLNLRICIIRECWITAKNEIWLRYLVFFRFN